MESLVSNEKVVELGSITEPVGKPSIIFSLLLFLLISVAIGFGLGYILGKTKTNTPQTNKTEKAVIETKDGKTTFSDPNENYSIVYPESWKGTQRFGDAPGVSLKGDGASVEIWLRVEQPYSFDEENKAAIVETNKVKLQVNGKEVEMTEHKYNTGAFFTALVLPATETTTLATFWIEANDSDLYTAAKTIVQSFKFN